MSLGIVDTCFAWMAHMLVSSHMHAKVSLCSLLEDNDGRALEMQVALKVLGDLADQSLEGEFANEQVTGLLVAAYLAEGKGSGAIPVRLLDAPCDKRRLAGGVGGKLLAGIIASCGLAGSLLSRSHGCCVFVYLGRSIGNYALSTGTLCTRNDQGRCCREEHAYFFLAHKFNSVILNPQGKMAKVLVGGHQCCFTGPME